MIFYLGTGDPGWLARMPVPLFVSHRRLKRYKTKPVAKVRWALDSGGFTELSNHGRWITTPSEYLDAIDDYVQNVGAPDWCAPQDWMVEPHMLALTGLSLDEHQHRTVENLAELRSMHPAVPVIPVIQGWTLSDYLRCIDLYTAAGIDLTTEPTVGVGSVCRRQHTDEAAEIITEVAAAGIAVHGFGLKMTAATKCGGSLTSCDSMAWSYNARRNERLPGCTHKCVTCTNCPRWALAWRERLLTRLANAPRHPVEP